VGDLDDGVGGNAAGQRNRRGLGLYDVTQAESTATDWLGIFALITAAVVTILFTSLALATASLGTIVRVLTIAGTSLELISVAAGSLALPFAKRFRNWLHHRLSLGLTAIAHHKVLAGAILTSLTACLVFMAQWNMTTSWSEVFVLQLPATIAVCLLAASDLLLAANERASRWLSSATDDRVQGVLVGIAALFALGVAMEVVAAVLDAT
jgi:hypothetical protein